MIHSGTLSNEVVLDVENVWKIYCRNLKKAMWYGIKDFGREMAGAGRDRTQGDLRPGEFFAVRDASFQLNQGECLASNRLGCDPGQHRPSLAQSL